MKESGGEEVEEDYNEVEWQRTVHHRLQLRAFRLRPERRGRGIQMRRFGLQGASALPSGHRGGRVLLGDPGGSRAGPDGDGAGVLSRQAQVREFLPLWDLSVSSGGPHRVLGRGGGRGHGVAGGEEVRALLRGFGGCKHGVRPAEGLPKGSGGFNRS